MGGYTAQRASSVRCRTRALGRVAVDVSAALWLGVARIRSFAWKSSLGVFPCIFALGLYLEQKHVLIPEAHAAHCMQHMGTPHRDWMRRHRFVYSASFCEHPVNFQSDSL